MGKQLKYADKRGARLAVIIGSEERERREASIKDLKLGAQLAETLEDRGAWKEMPQQFTVSREGLISAIVERLSTAPLS